MLSSVFVDRPRLAIVIALVTTIAGLVSLLAIPISQYPDIVPPQVSVTTTYPGASAAVVESTIAQPLESQIVGVDKAIYMKSVSGNDGSYSLLASFELGTNPDINTVNVNNRVQTALSKLPEDVQRQGVTVKKKSSALLGVIAVYSPKLTHDELFISNYATINLLDDIRSTARRRRREAVRPAGLRHQGLGADRPADRPRPHLGRHHQGRQEPERAGRRRAHRRAADLRRPAAAAEHPDQGPAVLGRRISRRSSSAPIPTARCCASRDVARLELGASNLDRATRLNGAPATLIGVYQSPGANALQTLAAVKAKLADARKSFPDDLEWKVTYDPTTFVSATIKVVEHTLVEAFILVVLVVFLFLGSLRATLIPTIAVPVSLIGTFVVLNAVGYSANTVSLLALILAIGIVVDDAIVVVEAVEAKMEQKPELTPAEATKEAMGEITAPIIAITLVLLSVFVPVAFIPGITGELFRQFAVTVAVSMFLSAINALTLSPALCAILLKPHHGPRRGPIGMVMRGIDHVRDAYGAVVARLVRISIIGLAMVAVSIFGILALNKVTPTGFLPEEDQGAFFVVVQLPDAASIGRTGAAVEQVENILKGEQAIADYSSIIGLNFIDNYSQPNAAFVIVTLKPFDERTDAADSAPAIIARLGEKFAGVSGGAGDPDLAAADHRARHGRRLQLCAARAEFERSQGAVAGAARPARRRQSGSAAFARLQHFLGQ